MNDTDLSSTAGGLRQGLERNAAVALGNAGTPEDLDVLTRALADPERLVRAHGRRRSLWPRRVTPRPP